MAGGLVRVVARPPDRRAAGGRAPASPLRAVAAARADPRRGGGPRGGRPLGAGDRRRWCIRPAQLRLLRAPGGPARSGPPPLAHVPARPAGRLAARARRRPAGHAAAAALLPRVVHGPGAGRPLARTGGAELGGSPCGPGPGWPSSRCCSPTGGGGGRWPSPSPFSSSSAGRPSQALLATKGWEWVDRAIEHRELVHLPGLRAGVPADLVPDGHPEVVAPPLPGRRTVCPALPAPLPPAPVPGRARGAAGGGPVLVRVRGRVACCPCSRRCCG